VDLDHEYLKLRRNRLRPKYEHGCKEADPCGRKAGYCPDRKQVRRETKNTKSRAGRRAVALPGPLVVMLRTHRKAQARERTTAGDLWIESDYVFTKPLGGPLSPNTDSIAHLFSALWAVPLESLAGHCRDAGEVVVAVQEGEPLQLRRRGDDEIHRTRTAMPSLFGEGFLDLPGAVVGAVVDGNPAEDQPHVFDAARPVGG
jgi:hypothetical protein